MSTQKRKFELFARLQALGFTYEESAALRRIEMTLQRWAEAECNGEIQRDEATGKPYRVYEQSRLAKRYPVADRESGALRRLAAIVAARNNRVLVGLTKSTQSLNTVIYYHQTDCRGCMVYLLTRHQLTEKHGTERHAKGALLPIEQYYNHGLAVCA